VQSQRLDEKFDFNISLVVCGCPASVWAPDEEAATFIKIAAKSEDDFVKACRQHLSLSKTSSDLFLDFMMG